MGLGLNNEIYGATHIQRVRMEAKVPVSDTRVVVSAGTGNVKRTSNREEPAFCSTCLADSSVGDKKLGLASELACLVRPPTGEVVRGGQLPAPDDLQLTGLLWKGSS